MCWFFFIVAQALCDFETSTIWVYDLNGKGCLTGCGLHGSSFVAGFFFFNRSIQYSWWFLNGTRLLGLRVLFCLFCCFCIWLLSSGGEMADYIKCELIGGGSPRHLNTFPNFFHYCFRVIQYEINQIKKKTFQDLFSELVHTHPTNSYVGDMSPCKNFPLNCSWDMAPSNFGPRDRHVTLPWN